MPAPPRDELSELFRDVVLVLGGVFAVRRTDDETIRQVARGLERAFRRARKQRGGVKTPPGSAGGGLAPHPAIAGLLQLIDSEEATR